MRVPMAQSGSPMLFQETTSGSTGGFPDGDGGNFRQAASGTLGSRSASADLEAASQVQCCLVSASLLPIWSACDAKMLQCTLLCVASRVEHRFLSHL